MAWAAAGRARADGFTATLEPIYTHQETDVTDQSGRKTHQSEDLISQRYQAAWDRTLTESLSAGVGGTFLDDHGWIRTDGVNSEAHGRATNLFGRLSLGTPVLTAGLGADRREQSLISSGSSPAAIQEDYTAFAAWRPLDLPELELRLNRTNAYDATHQFQDTTTDSALFSIRYKGPNFDLRYTLSVLRTDDLLHASESTAVDQTVLASRSDSFFSGRTTTYLSATVQDHVVTIGSRGSGGVVTQQQVPAAGLSGVTAPPATSSTIILSPNPGLIDGNTTAAAGLNVGFGPSSTGDVNRREAGARFADVVTQVNTIYVWFDKAPVGTVGQALASSIQVWQSNDPTGQLWTPVTIPTAPFISPFQNRIEITLPQMAARFLKVSVQPIAVGVTTDLSYRDLNITEIQFLLVLPIAQLPKQQSSLFVTGTALARTILLKEPELAHDFSATAGHRTDSDVTTYALVNGLSATKKLGDRLTASARAARQDTNSGAGHEGFWLWSAALAGTPLPTANWTLTYAGTYSDRDEVTHSLNALGRADWYQGISTQASAGGSFTAQGLRIGSSVQGATTTSFRPNTLMTLSVGVLYSRTVGSNPDTGTTVTQTGRLDGSLTLTPAPAMSATGTVSRIFLGDRLTTLATVQLNYFPLRGDLQLGATYSKTLDTEAQQTIEILTPSLRWNVRSGVSLMAAYSYLKNAAPVQTSVSRVTTVDLIVNL